MAETPKCDFCSSTPGAGKRSYFALSKISLRVEASQWTPLTDYIDTGEWVACAMCASLIDHQLRKSLMGRFCRLSPAARPAAEMGRLQDCCEFVARTWSAVFDVPAEAFLE